MNQAQITTLKQVAEAAGAAYEAEKARLVALGFKSQERYNMLKALKADLDAKHAAYRKNWTPPSAKELERMEREFNAASHDIKITLATDKAVAVAVDVEYCDLERDARDTIWLPKSALVDGRAPGWLLNRKLNEIHADHSNRKLGSILVKLAA